MDKQYLESSIRENIPLSRSMDFRIQTLGDTSISVQGGQQENINIHGTAFAGSLYCLCTLAVWGLVYSHLPEHAVLVIAQGHIDYHKPVIGNITAKGTIDSKHLTRFLNQLQQQGKATVETHAMVATDSGELGVRFQATLHANTRPAQTA